MEEINDICTIECLRKVNAETYYSVFQSDQNGILIISFRKDDNKFKVSGFWYMETLLFKSDFKTLKVGDTYEDVLKVANNWDGPVFFNTGTITPDVSNHETIDGYVVTMTYKRENIIKESKIKRIEIKKSSKHPYSIYPNLIPMDIETIKEELGEK